MKKVLLLTFQWTDNYGGVLQNYALYRVLRDMGCDVEVLDYHNTRLISKRYSLLAKVKHKCWEIVKGPFGFWKRHKRTNAFKRETMFFTRKHFTDYEELVNCFEDYDYAFVGSDQVWNFTISNDPKAFLLAFVEKPKKVSYAASFGVDFVPNEYVDYLKQELPKFAMVSVRDSFSQKIANSFLPKKSSVVLDPTLLLDSCAWMDVVGNTQCVNGNYVLCYYMPNSNAKLMTMLKRLSSYIGKKHGLKVINIGKKEYEKMKLWQNNKTDVGPKEFLSLIKNASFIVTNSFHGTIFSINFNKEFYVCYDSSASSNSNLSKRIESVLDELGLLDRLVDCNQPLDAISFDHQIEFTNVNNSLCLKRNDSLNFLKESLK